MSKLCEGRVVIVTGAGRGIGREHALAFAREGAAVVVNDLGTSLSGDAAASGVTGEVVEEIRRAGGRAIANADDVADFAAAERLVAAAIEHFGRLDVVVNNAGFVRDRMFANISESEWDAVLRVHLKGHFCVSRHACTYWRERAKAGEAVDARIINTSSGAGLLGSVGQGAYSTAKAGILGLTLVQAAELGRYGITANAIAPAARTRMTEQTFADAMKQPEQGFDAMHAANIAPLVVWLGSAEARHVTGRVFEIQGGELCLFDGHQRGPSARKDARWEPSELGAVVGELISRAQQPLPVYGQG
jgi:NAD(P)-dependent dehydrogenase (short-subunit alcohol dehydrogenase family)